MAPECVKDSGCYDLFLIDSYIFMEVGCQMEVIERIEKELMVAIQELSLKVVKLEEHMKMIEGHWRALNWFLMSISILIISALIIDLARYLK